MNARFLWHEGDVAYEPPLAQRQFLLGLDLAEERLRAGRYGPELNTLVGELQELVEQEDVVAVLLADGESVLADRFDAVVQAGKELRGETVPERAKARCTECPGAMHTTEKCPFRWGEPR